MIDYFQPLSCDPGEFGGQFVLTKDAGFIPKQWTVAEQRGWLLGVSRLPVAVIKGANGKASGWCIGNPVNLDDSDPLAGSLAAGGGATIDMAAVEQFYATTAGRYILILLKDDEEKLFLDPYGSLAAVIADDRQTVASTPTFFRHTHAWDMAAIQAIGMPEQGTYFPLGLTAREGVERLLPNHCLDLRTWTVQRHWPRSADELRVNENIDAGVDSIIDVLQKTIGGIARRHPLQLALTAGRDTRIILACAKEFLADASFITFADCKPSLDIDIATRLTKRLKLKPHVIIPYSEASKEELVAWLYCTGHAVSGAIWQKHQCLTALDSRRVLLNGISVELGRAKFWRAGDSEGSTITAEELLTRCKYPLNGVFLTRMEKWLAKLKPFNAFTILDLCNIELGLGPCCGPQHYANTYSLFEVAPFNHRRLFRTMMQFPYAFRRRKALANEICGRLWPELLDLPFNDYPCIKKCAVKVANVFGRTIRKIKC